MSYTSLTYHIVLTTYRRWDTIRQAHERELYKYIYNIATNKNVLVRRIGGIPNHVHILCDIPPSIPVSEFVRFIKAESSKFMKINENFPELVSWGKSYSAFTVDASLREVRRQYILHQREHHANKSFEEEIRELLTEAGIDPAIAAIDRD